MGTIYSKSMKGSLIATRATLELIAARATSRPMRPNPLIPRRAAIFSFDFVVHCDPVHTVIFFGNRNGKSRLTARKRRLTAIFFRYRNVTCRPKIVTNNFGYRHGVHVGVTGSNGGAGIDNNFDCFGCDCIISS